MCFMTQSLLHDLYRSALLTQPCCEGVPQIMPAESVIPAFAKPAFQSLRQFRSQTKRSGVPLICIFAITLSWGMASALARFRMSMSCGESQTLNTDFPFLTHNRVAALRTTPEHAAAAHGDFPARDTSAEASSAQRVFLITAVGEPSADGCVMPPLQRRRTRWPT